jgi:hypothetical protein
MKMDSTFRLDELAGLYGGDVEQLYGTTIGKMRRSVHAEERQAYGCVTTACYILECISFTDASCCVEKYGGVTVGRLNDTVAYTSSKLDQVAGFIRRMGNSALGETGAKLAAAMRKTVRAGTSILAKVISLAAYPTLSRYIIESYNAEKLADIQDGIDKLAGVIRTFNAGAGDDFVDRVVGEIRRMA